MGMHAGQKVWVGFPGQRVAATVTEVGEDEVRILEDGASEPEWVPRSWCQHRD